MSSELVRCIGDSVAKPVDAMTTQREDAGEDQHHLSRSCAAPSPMEEQHGVSGEGEQDDQGPATAIPSPAPAVARDDGPHSALSAASSIAMGPALEALPHSRVNPAVPGAGGGALSAATRRFANGEGGRAASRGRGRIEGARPGCCPRADRG